MTMKDNQKAQRASEHLDVLIVGAGISGIGAAYNVQHQLSSRSFAVLDALEGPGGTWWTHRYSGARSDSDLYTYGYKFKPWSGRSIATADEIRDYLASVIDENDLASHIRYRHKVTTADWSSESKCWTVAVTQLDTGKTLTMTASFLWLCQGYYDHQKGYVPEWSGMNRFQGTMVHPQHWPQDLEYTDKRIVVIGSGATAATLIPALVDRAEHVTMLQRSPTFFAAAPWAHELEEPLRALNLPEEWFHEILRRAHLARTTQITRMALEQPDELRTMLLDDVRARLPEGFDVDKHFNPRYRPWQQRVAVVPDGDLFNAVGSGKASVVTDGIEHFDEKGIVLTSGERLDADIVVTATGFNLSLFGGVQFSVDGEAVEFPRHVTYRGIMINGLPNMAYIMGYFRFSWTLRVDLVSDYVCRLLQHMDSKGAGTVVPTLRPEDADMPILPWSDSKNFNAGYVMRSQHLMHGRGDREPWSHHLEYYEERDSLPSVDLDDGVLLYN